MPKQVVISVGCNVNDSHPRARGEGATVADAMEAVQRAMVAGKWAGRVALDRTYAFCPDCARDLDENNPGRDGT